MWASIAEIEGLFEGLFYLRVEYLGLAKRVAVILRTSRLRAGHVRCLIQTITCHRIYAQPRSRGASG